MSRELKVLLLVENNSYPLDFRVRREAQSLRDAGCQVCVIAPKLPSQSWTEQIDDVRVFRFPALVKGAGTLSYALEFGYSTVAILLIAMWVGFRHGVDVVHAANPPDTLFLVGATFKLFGKKFVFDQHDLAPETYLSRFGRTGPDGVYHVLRFLERATYALADVVVATNESYKELALTRGEKPESSVFVVRNGPPLSYECLDVDASASRHAPFQIGYVGTIGPQDGLDYWIRAIHELVFNLGRRDFTAIVIGDGDALAQVRDLARELGVEGYVRFTGRLPEAEVRRYLLSCHVCVQPDPMNPLNDRSTMNKLMEYMALAKPTVAFDLRETRRSAQAAAVYARPNDVQHFAGLVSWLLDHPAERAQMGQFGRDRVRTSLAWEYSAIELIRSYREGLGVEALDQPCQHPESVECPVLSVSTQVSRAKACCGENETSGNHGSSQRPADQHQRHQGRRVLG